MTNTSVLIKTLFKEKNTTVHKIIGLHVLTLLITLIAMILENEFNSINFANLSLVYGGIGASTLFIRFALRIEKMWTSNTYRLIPVSESRLYAANFLSAVASFVYFLILEVIIIGVSSIKPLSTVKLPTHILLGYFVCGLIFMIMLVLTGWTFNCLAHLIENTISNFLPDKWQGLLQSLLYVATFILLLIILSVLNKPIGTIINKLFSPLYSASTPLNIIFTLLMTSVFMLLWTVVLTIPNLYLLKHWVETE